MYSLDEKMLKKRFSIPLVKPAVITDIDTEDELILKKRSVKQLESSGGVHKSSHIKQSEVISANFISADLSDSKLDRVFVEKSRLSGMSVAGSILVDVLFKRCKINRASFRGAKITRVIFYECDLTDADFQSADLDGAVFKSCKLCEADYSNAKVKDVDLRGSYLKGARFGSEQFKGLTIDQSQATYFVLLAGITIDQ